ncbi:MAG: FemAB family protein [Microgenomates group bacterium GW2011_GWA2_47_8]|nr:MAG: FemAB family protein [Microgenomates group bacterium GW2011_GWA2_47_8]
MSHPLQSPAWREFRKSMGIDVVRLNDWYVTFHSVPHTPWTIGYFPKGPMPDEQMIAELMKLGKEKRAIFIQLEPNVVATPNGLPITDFRLRTSHHPLFTKYTFVLDLAKSEEELLAAMHSKTRYNIRVAQKHGVTIVQDNSEEAFDAYLKLSEETTSRQGLAWVVFVWGDTIYYPYGASSREHREVMAPNLMLWEIARWAKARNLKHFDLWGAISPHPDPNDPWYGFHRFKEGFRPRLVAYMGSFDLIIHPFLYRLYMLADTLRWMLLRIRATFRK